MCRTVAYSRLAGLGFLSGRHAQAEAGLPSTKVRLRVVAKAPRAAGQAPGARYSTERFAAASTSSGVMSTVVRTFAAPAALTVRATAVALSLSGRSMTV